MVPKVYSTDPRGSTTTSKGICRHISPVDTFSGSQSLFHWSQGIHNHFQGDLSTYFSSGYFQWFPNCIPQIPGDPQPLPRGSVDAFLQWILWSIKLYKNDQWMHLNFNCHFVTHWSLTYWTMIQSAQWTSISLWRQYLRSPILITIHHVPSTYIISQNVTPNNSFLTSDIL